MTGAVRRAMLEGLAPAAVVEDVAPQVDGGRFAVKRVVGEEIEVTASAFAHGHEKVAVTLRYRGPDDASWTEAPMEPLGNDRWRGAFGVDRIGEWSYCVASRAEQSQLAAESPVYPAWVDRERARCGAWYEIFPRSTSPEPGRHGTFADLDERLDAIAAMGFDVVYLPPIHPIGREKRKGRNNSTVAAPGDVGSPWAIGAAEGGHTAIHPDLGDRNDFRHLLRSARLKGMEIALDIAFQCTPDHPWVTEHPDWFRHRPDGSIQCAENPPKRYEDIYPLDFDTPDWKALWTALRDVVGYWAREGVEVFRVDNPHTKPFAFWEWLIDDIRRDHPRAIFLSEAFTRPRVMHRLAKLGFSQSYTYFTWRNTRAELTEYFTELAASPSREYFRPNVWPNTPDILPYPLQGAGPAAFRARLVLATTLAASYGIYGPAFELAENRPRDPGTSEEYLESEKYELKRWDADRADSLAPLVTRLNAIRRAHPALQSDWSLAFHATDNDQLLCYSKRSGEDRVLVVVNLDWRNVQSGWVELDPAALEIAADAAFTVQDELNGERYRWSGGRNFVMLDPARAPAHVFSILPQ